MLLGKLNKVKISDIFLSALRIEGILKKRHIQHAAFFKVVTI